MSVFRCKFLENFDVSMKFCSSFIGLNTNEFEIFILPTQNYYNYQLLLLLENTI